MLAGGAELGLVHGRLQVALVASDDAVRVRRHAASRSSSTSRTTWFFARSAFLHHLLGWTFLIAAVFPLGMVFWPAVACVPDGVRTHVRGARDDALHRPRRRADLRSPVAARRDCRTDETARPHRARSRCCSRPRHRRTPRCGRRRRAFATELQTGPQHDPPPLRPGGADRCRARSRFSTRTARTSRAPPAPRRPTSSRPSARSRAARTPCAGMRSRPTRTSSRASGPSVFACPRRRRSTHTAPAGRRRSSTSFAGCGSWRSRSRSARSASA